MQNTINIYYSCSIRGQNNNNISQKHIDVLKHFGNVLNSDLVSNPDGKRTDDEIFSDDMKLLEKAHLIVADVTYPSLGVGFILAKAHSMKKKVIIVYDSLTKKYEDISAMIKGANFYFIKEGCGYEENSFGGELHFSVCLREFFEKELNIVKPKILIIGSLENETNISKIAESFNLQYINVLDILDEIKGCTDCVSESVSKIITDFLSDSVVISNGYIVDANSFSEKDLDVFLCRDYTKPNFIVKLFGCENYNLSKNNIPYVEFNSKDNVEENLYKIIYGIFKIL